jgi:hypothetical protein
MSRIMTEEVGSAYDGYGKKKTVHVCYESIEEFEAALSKELTVNKDHAQRTVYERSNKHRENYGNKWFGCDDGITAMQKVKDGWPEMYARLMNMWGDVRPELKLSPSTVHVRRRKRMRADYGDTLDMHRVWSGELDKAWERPERTYRLSASQRHAIIYIDLGTTCIEKADSVLWRSAAAILICDLLQATGRSVEIYVGAHQLYPFEDARGMWGDSGKGNSDVPQHLRMAMRVKAYTQPLHMEQLSAMVTMAFYRTYGFLMIMANPYKTSESLGFLDGGKLPEQLLIRERAGELVVRIGHCNTMEGAEQEFFAVQAALAKEAT